MQRFDFIIAGGGVSGLSLAYHLVHSPLGGSSMLVIEPGAQDRKDHAMSFWSDQATPFDPIIRRSWNRLQIRSEELDRSIDLGGWRYNTLRSADYDDYIHRDLSARPNVKFLRATVEQIADGPDFARVRADGRYFMGAWVFDSRFRLADFSPDPAHYLSLRQHFKGWLIETHRPAFNPDAATLFDFRVPQSHELRFFYVLPYTDRRALVEYVLLSPENFDEAIRGYVETTLGIRDYRILSKEGGVTPLSNYPFPRRAGQRVMTIGIQGGRVKPSSGYAFTRIQGDSAAIVRSLVKTGSPFAVPGDAPFYHFCDSTLLHIMRQDGGNVKSIYLDLFKNNPVQRVFHFLDETAAPGENLAMMLSLPSQLFWKAMAQAAWQAIRNLRRTP